MRHVQKDIDDIPASLLEQDCLDSLNAILEDTTIRANSKIYRGFNNSFVNEEGISEPEVVRKLKLLYHNKCAYCENLEYEPEIEHYRPLRKVINVRPIHNGYYWLCYEWTNLVPSCHVCNKVGGGKGNKFPIIDETNRQRTHLVNEMGQLDQTKMKAHQSPLINEQPYLLHPEIDDPKLYFRFSNNGSMRGIDNEGRGEKTISICNLNRQNLKVARQAVIDRFVESFSNALKSFHKLKSKNQISGNSHVNAQNQLKNDLKNIFQQLENRQAPHRTYTLMAWYIYQNFEDIFLPLFKIRKYKRVIRDAYRAYLRGEL